MGNERRADTKKCPDQRTRNDGIRLQGEKAEAALDAAAHRGGTDSLEIMKSGLSNTHMIFEKNKKNLTYYKTLYGQMLVGLNTRNMEIEVSDETIKVRVDYELDVNHEPLANCKIRMNIVSKGSGIAV